MSEIMLNKQVVATPEQIWTVITDPSLVSEWLYPIDDFAVQINNSFTIDWEGEVCELKVIAIDSPILLQFNMSFPNYKATSVVEFQISDFLNKESMITIQQTDLEEFPTDLPMFETTAFETNWGIILDRLVMLIQKQTSL